MAATRRTRRGRRPIRDQGLLDALEKVGQRRYRATCGVRSETGRGSPGVLAVRRPVGRRNFDVLYTSETREAAIAERRFHLYQGQPIPPSKVRYELFELQGLARGGHGVRRPRYPQRVRPARSLDTGNCPMSSECRNTPLPGDRRGVFLSRGRWHSRSQCAGARGPGTSSSSASRTRRSKRRSSEATA